MARVRGLAPDRLLSAIILVVMTLFVASGVPDAGRWRRPLRLAALGGFAVALLLALALIGRWLADAGR
jgi:hypothetical protein